MSHHTCEECGEGGRDQIFHRPECSRNDVSLEDRLLDIENRLDALEGDDDDHGAVGEDEVRYRPHCPDCGKYMEEAPGDHAQDLTPPVCHACFTAPQPISRARLRQLIERFAPEEFEHWPMGDPCSICSQPEIMHQDPEHGEVNSADGVLRHEMRALLQLAAERLLRSDP